MAKKEEGQKTQKGKGTPSTQATPIPPKAKTPRSLIDILPKIGCACVILAIVIGIGNVAWGISQGQKMPNFTVHPGGVLVSSSSQPNKPSTQCITVAYVVSKIDPAGSNRALKLDTKRCDDQVTMHLLYKGKSYMTTSAWESGYVHRYVGFISPGLYLWIRFDSTETKGKTQGFIPLCDGAQLFTYKASGDTPCDIDPTKLSWDPKTDPTFTLENK